MHMVAWALGQPGIDKRSFMSAVIIHDQMNFEVGRYFLVDAVEEFAKFHTPVPAMTLADYFAGGDVECGKQRCGAIAEVIVGTALSLAGPHRQNRLHAIERLDLGLLV